MTTLVIGLADFQHTGGWGLQDDAVLICVLTGLTLIGMAAYHLCKPSAKGLCTFSE
jgi:hypothetical protein